MNCLQKIGPLLTLLWNSHWSYGTSQRYWVYTIRTIFVNEQYQVLNFIALFIELTNFLVFVDNHLRGTRMATFEKILARV